MDISKTLSQFDLAGNKGVVYLTALEVGTGSVQSIANIAKLPRTTVHEILLQLNSMGLVSSSNRGRKRIFAAESPEKLKTILKEKERRLDLAMPELLLHMHTAGLRPRVRFYDGENGVKAVFEDTLTVKDKLLYGILSMEDLYKIPGKDFMDSYVGRRVALGIKLKVIRSESKEVEETWPTSQEENRELHYAPTGFTFPMTMYLYDGKVGIIGTEKEQFGMIIESKDFFLTQKNMFEIMWQIGKVGKAVK